MPRSRLETLLPASMVSNSSRSELLGQLASQTRSMGSGGASGSIDAGLPTNAGSPAAEQLTTLTSQIASLASVQQAQIGAVQDNTQALAQNTSSKAGAGSSVGSTAENVASSVLGGGLSVLSPLISGVLSLFGGGGSDAPARPLPYMLPLPVQSQAGVTSSAPGQIVPVSYSESGQPRGQAAASSPQVTIQVNAMDSRSFLDHSEDIAMAVKHAILNSNSLNDVLSSL